MPRSLKLFTLFGTPVRFHYTWPIAAIPIAGLLIIYPDIRRIPTWDDILFGASFMVILTASVLVHEMAHVLVARRLGIRSTGVTLFALGGISHLDDVTNRPRSELFIAIAGPMVSIAIGLGTFVFATTVDQQSYSSTVQYYYTADGQQQHVHLPPEVTVLSQTFQYIRYLAVANLIIGLFNLLPLFPLDGGRVLSAILWAITKDRARGIRVAALIGQLGAAAIIVYGAYNLFFGELLVGVWLIAIGVFLMEAAIGSAPIRESPLPEGEG